MKRSLAILKSLVTAISSGKVPYLGFYGGNGGYSLELHRLSHIQSAPDFGNFKTLLTDICRTTSHCLIMLVYY